MSILRTCGLCFVVWASGICRGDILVHPPHLITEETRAELRISAPDLANEGLRWRVGMKNATLGEGTLRVDADGEARLILDMPALRAGEPLPLTLLVSGPDPARVLSETRLWVFPKDPLRDIKARLRARSLRLYDPEGGTEAWLKGMEVPYEQIFDALDAADGVLLVGEGVSFDTHSELAGKLRRLAASGVVVLCLRPRDGLADLLDPDTGPVPSTWTLSSEAFFTDLDPRLLGSGLVFQNFKPVADEERVRFNLHARTGWPWAEFHYPGGGVLAFCGAELTDPDVASPAPAVLLKALLRYLDSTHQPKGKKP
ncbi:MAG: hypothetical protein WD708_12910 [Kiritimatiellia bacterium]